MPADEPEYYVNVPLWGGLTVNSIGVLWLSQAGLLGGIVDDFGYFSELSGLFENITCNSK